MDFHLLSYVRQQDDGSQLGELRRVIYDPERRQLVSLIVQESDLAGHAVVVPMDVVAAADDDAVYVSLTLDQLRDLEPYAYAVNVAPPPADVDPRTHSADLDEELLDIPDVAPVGAADGITSIAFTPIMEVQRSIPEGAVPIDDATSVFAGDRDLGNVKRISVDDTSSEVSAFMVERGLIFTHAIEVPAEWVAGVETGRIDLNVPISVVEEHNRK